MSKDKMTDLNWAVMYRRFSVTPPKWGFILYDTYTGETIQASDKDGQLYGSRLEAETMVRFLYGNNENIDPRYWENP